MSFNPAEILTKELQSTLRANWKEAFGSEAKNFADVLSVAASVAMELTYRSDALFHNGEFVLQVVCVGQALLKGLLVKEGHISPREWMHFTLATLFCNIGMIRGVLKVDDSKNNLFFRGQDVEPLLLPDGCTDAALNAYTVKRSQQFVEEYFGNHPIVDAKLLKELMDVTLFPLPNPDQHRNKYQSLLLSSIIIGEIADARWLQRITQLYFEYKENGVAKMLGYSTPGDLKKNYPEMFWKCLHPCISSSIPFLEATQNGQTILSLCFANIFTLEHSREKSNVIGFGLQAIIDPADQEKLSEFALK